MALKQVSLLARTMDIPTVIWKKTHKECRGGVTERKKRNGLRMFRPTEAALPLLPKQHAMGNKGHQSPP